MSDSRPNASPTIRSLPVPTTTPVSTSTNGEMSSIPNGVSHSGTTRDITTTGEVLVGGATFWTYEHAAGVFNVSYSAISKLVNDSNAGIVANNIGKRKFICVNSLRKYLSHNMDR